MNTLMFIQTDIKLEPFLKFNFHPSISYSYFTIHSILALY